MTSDSRIIYWDTCIFLAWLKNEKRPGVEMAGLVSIAHEITKGNFHLITSVTTMAEVLFNRSGKGIADRFKNLFKQSNVDAINIDERIATKAGEIREYYIEASKKDGKPALGFADALHLATAIVQEATVFHTFDDSDKNHRGLLGLNNNVAGHPLVIEKPSTNQGVFYYGGPKPGDDQES